MHGLLAPYTFRGRITLVCILLTATVLLVQDSNAQELSEQESVAEVAPNPRAADLKKIEAAIESYVTAFNTRDVDSLIALWAPDGVYVSRQSGDRLEGHDQLRRDFEEIAKQETPPTLAVQTESIEFISPNVALERGTAVVSQGDNDEQTAYRVVYIKQDGKWLIDRVTEEIVFPKASNYEQLRELEFLVGNWISEAEEITVEFDCNWTANQNYISRRYRVIQNDQVESSGLQLIGWDAREEKIRSWLFDSNGGFVKGEWNQRGDHWSVQTVATLADGAAGSSTNLIYPVNEDEFRWRNTNRVIDGKLLPNTEEIIVQRR